MAQITLAPTDSTAIKRATIMVGAYRDGAALLRALVAAEVQLSERVVNSTLPFVVSTPKLSLATVAFVTPDVLGLRGNNPLHVIVRAAEENGLQPCTPEIGPALRLLYDNQPEGEWAIAVGRKFCDDRGMVNFVLGKVNGYRYLNAESGEGSVGFKSDTLFIFLERIVRPERA